MSTTKFVFNPFTGNLDEMVNTIDLTTDVTGILPVANGGTGLSALLQAGSSLYVDNSRTDTYTADGSSSKPFKTLTAALAQVVTNNTGGFYTIIVNAGDYGTEDISLNNAAFTRIAIVAQSVANGQLYGSPIPVTSIRDITSTTNNDNLKALLISGFTFRNLTMIGASNGSTFCQYGSMISNCSQLSTANTSIDVENAGRVIFADCGFSQSSGNGDVTVQNVLSFSAYKCLMSIGTMTIISNGALNKPVGFTNTGTQFSFGSLAGAISLGAGATLATRWNRVLATTSISGTMSSIIANFIGAVTINSGGVWNSTGDLVNSVPTNAGTINQLGTMRSSGANLSSLTASMPVQTDASKNLVSSAINLTSQVSGVLPEANGGTHQSTYAAGDILYASATNTLSKLPVSADGDVLTLASGLPSWAPSSGGSGTPASALYQFVTAAGYGATNTAIPYYSSLTASSDSAGLLSVVNSSTFGLSVTALKACTVTMTFPMGYGTGEYKGISKNSNQLSTTFDSITQADKMAETFSATNVIITTTATIPLAPGDVLRPHLATGQSLNGYIMIISASAVLPANTSIAPTVQKFLSGSGTYTKPTSPAPLYIRVRMVGGGGGGAGGGQTGTSGSGGNGTDTLFGSSLLSAGLGLGGVGSDTVGGLGGNANLNSAVGLALYGGSGNSGGQVAINTVAQAGGTGGASVFSGNGGGASYPSAGRAAAVNSGSGGGGGAEAGNNGIAGAGGGAGGYVEGIIYSPSATYSYTVGAGGAGGTAGTTGTAGGNGADGQIIVEEFYQ